MKLNSLTEFRERNNGRKLPFGACMKKVKTASGGDRGKTKGCMMCDLALAILEEIEPEFEKGTLRWK